MMSEPMIGQSVPRTEARRFVAGKGRYVDDIKRPGMLHAVIVRSHVAHGTIKAVHADDARAMPGVVAVFTHGDIGDLLKPIPQRVCPLPGMERFLQRPIALDRVRYVGEPIAVVVAQDRYVAEDAAEQVWVECDMLPCAVDAEAAARDTVVLHPEQGTNVTTHYHGGVGDCDAAFAAAEHVFTERFYVHRHSAVSLETRGLCAEWDAQAEHLTVWGATKVPFANRAILADMLGLRNDQVDLLEVDVGGSFGVRGDFYPEDFLIPFVAKRLGAPVKWVEDRRENLQAANHSRECWCDLSIAVDAQGHILGMRGRWLSDIGAYVRTNAGVMPGKGTQFLTGPYRIAASRFETLAVCTNKTPSGTYRGPGRYESSFFRERLIDIAAQAMAIDPAEFRRRNLIPPDAMPYDAGALVPDMGPAIYDSGDYPEVFRIALERFDYAARTEKNGALIDGEYHGVGMGCFVESTGGGPGEGARLELRRNGRFDLFVGASSAGQGHETSMAQVLADALEVPFSRISVCHGSTNLLEQGYGAYHSRSAVMAGNATWKVAQAMKERLVAEAAALGGLDAATLKYERGNVIDAEGNIVADLAALAARAEADEVPLDRGHYSVETRFMHNELTYTFGVQLAHVAVDPQTAQVRVLDFYCVEDIGRVINPDIVHGQTIGAAVQGLGGSFLDEYVYDEHGQLLTGSFADYLLPLATDFPVVRGDTLSLSPSPGNPLGVKGAGEGGIIATGAALGNAVSNALRGLGVSVTRLPMSMNNLAAWLRQARERAGNEPMKVNGQYTLEASRERVWQGLLDPETLRASIPGCEAIDKVDENTYQLTIRAAIGPVNARVNATMELQDIVENTSYALSVKGNAGPAGFAGGVARVNLASPSSSTTQLTYEAEGQLGGKLAQVGSRLIEGIVAKIANEFFERFQQQIVPTSPVGVATAPAQQAAASERRRMPWAMAGAGVLAVLAAVYFLGG